MSETLRLNYFQRQLLGAADFTDEQAYLRNMRRRHNLGPHGWGVVTGLRLVELPRDGDPDFRDLVLMPGLAIDLFGREIIVFSPTPLSPSTFAGLPGEQNREVWIGYQELPVADGMGGRMLCTGVDSYTRIEESFQIYAGPLDPKLWDVNRATVYVGGEPAATPALMAMRGVVQLPPDGAEPEQDFEAQGEVVTWLLRLGSVHWDQTANKFRPVGDPANLSEGRVWAGLFGGSLLSESGTLELAPRVAFDDPDQQPFADIAGRLSVQGKLTAEKDVELDGGKLLFDTSTGSDDGAPLYLQRRPVPADGIAAELNVHIGDDIAAKTTRFSIGAGAPTVKPVLAVRADRKVDVTDGKLRLGGKTRQSIDLSVETDGADGAYGIGVQNGAAYMRTASDVYWYIGGSHDDTAGVPGNNGSVLLQLDASGRLLFGAQTRQMLNLWADHYGVGVQSYTLYQRSDADFCWYRRGAHRDGRDDPGPGGTLAMKLDENNTLTVSGDIIADGNLFARGHRAPLIDVRSGVYALNMTPGPGLVDVTGTVDVDFDTELATWSGASAIVALSDISNKGPAIDARWKVEAGPVSRVADNKARFTVTYYIHDTDGWLSSFCWIAILTA
jgi:hypothetical protein